MRAERDTAHYTNAAQVGLWVQYLGLPYLRLVDGLTGFSFPDPRMNTPRRTERGKVSDVPPPESSSPHSPGPQEGHDDEEPTTSH